MTDFDSVAHPAVQRLAEAAPEGADPVVAIVSYEHSTLWSTDPLRSGSLGLATRAILDSFAHDDGATVQGLPPGWEPGDAAVSNDPFHGGVDVTDFTLVRPMEGGAVTIRMRLPDMGGFQLGGLAPESFDVWGEGARITPLKISLGGRRRREAWDLLTMNSRTPRLLQHLLAMMEQEAAGLAATLAATPLWRDGADRAKEAVAAARTVAGALRPGTYEVEGAVEVPASASWPCPVVRLVARIDGGRIDLDFRGSDPQVEAPLNSTAGHTLDCCHAAVVRCLPEFPRAPGAVQAVRVLAGDGTVTGAQPPATTGLSRFLTARAIHRVVASALARAGAPVGDPDGWWEEHGRQVFGEWVDPETFRLQPGRAVHIKALEQGGGKAV